MTRDSLQTLINDFSDNSQLNYLPKSSGDAAPSSEYESDNFAKNNLIKAGADADMYASIEADGVAGMRFYQHPIFSVTRADAAGFDEIRRAEVVGPHHTMPQDWLPGAKTVISFFLPYERRIVEANKVDALEPAVEWLYARVDGQRFLLALGTMVCEKLRAEGYNAVAPYTEDGYIMQTSPYAAPGTEHVPPYNTNWSERHVGVVSGLGTFGKSTNFISRIGCAGRLISIITDWEPEADVPDYTDWLGYCNDCGACIRRCPAQAHFPDRHGKDHAQCSAYIGKVCAKYEHRYGCGKCQSGIPCEYTPMRRKA